MGQTLPRTASDAQDNPHLDPLCHLNPDRPCLPTTKNAFPVSLCRTLSRAGERTMTLPKRGPALGKEQGSPGLGLDNLGASSPACTVSGSFTHALINGSLFNGQIVRAGVTSAVTKVLAQPLEILSPPHGALTAFPAAGLSSAKG